MHNPVPWVDDPVFDGKWENEVQMETAAARDLNFNVHFIPKSRTDRTCQDAQCRFARPLKCKRTRLSVQHGNDNNNQERQTNSMRRTNASINSMNEFECCRNNNTSIPILDDYIVYQRGKQMEDKRSIVGWFRCSRKTFTNSI